MRSLLMILLLVAGSSTAGACGNPLLWAMLFAKVPEAKMVYDAELSAREDGALKARVYTAQPGQTYHAWSKDWLIALAEDMQPTVNGVLQPGESMTILFADEVAALRFTGGVDPVLIPAAGLGQTDRFDLITTINALNGAWHHGLSYQDMAALKLISTGTPTAETRFSALF